MLRDVWSKYLIDPGSADEGDFTALLTDAEEAISPEEAFAFLGASPELVRRARSLIDQTTFNGLYYLPEPRKFLSQVKLQKLAMEQVSGFCDFLREIGKDELANGLSTLETKTLDDRSEFNEIVSESFPNKGISFVGDRLVYATFDQDERLSAVREAVLGLTMDVFVADYILTGAVKFPMSYKPGFELYVGGGELAILDDLIVLLVPRDEVLS